MNRFLLLFFVTLLSTSLFSQTRLYWGSSTNEIFSSNLDGSDLQVINNTVDFPEGIDIDALNGKIYFMDGGVGSALMRSDLDGSNIETLVSGMISPDGVALDVCGGKVYFAASGDSNLSRANLDGSDVEVLVSGPDLFNVEGVAVDATAGKVYWARTSGNIHSANLDGSNPQLVLTGSGPISLAKEMSTGKIYWTEINAGTVRRADPDGSNIETLISGLPTSMGGISIDPTNGHMYFAVGGGEIRRADLDGTNMISISPGSGSIAIDLAIDNPISCAQAVEPIPTMSQWGLLVFGLLIMNLGVFFVQRRVLI